MAKIIIDFTFAASFLAFALLQKKLKLNLERSACILIGVVVNIVVFTLNFALFKSGNACVCCAIALIAYVLITAPKPEEEADEEEDGVMESSEENSEEKKMKSRTNSIKNMLSTAKFAGNKDDSVPNEDGLTYADVRDKLFSKSNDEQNSVQYVTEVTEQSKRDFIEACALCGFVTDGKTIEQLVSEVVPCISEVQIRNLPSNLRSNDTLLAMNALKAKISKGGR